MDRKSKKRIQMLNDKLQNRRQQLATAKKQPDEAGERERLEHEVSEIETELARLKKT